MINSWEGCFVLLICAISTAVCDEVCYDELGCFSDDWPFVSLQRPISYLPWSPAEINTEFWLYTRRNSRFAEDLRYDDETTISESNFRALKPTKVIIHGFVSDGQTRWVKNLKDALLDVEDVNVIVVNWEKGANPRYDYGQACANTRVVGAEIAVLMQKLKSVTGALHHDFHLIGHSLGAHIGGYVGERIRTLGRITGLDAAEPFFQGTEPAVRLDPTDAAYVDAIHTDGKPYWQLGWGMMEPVGHADFYPNGGQDQPGCPGNEEEEGHWWQVTCNHGRACELMIDSIVNQQAPMIGKACSSYEEYLNGNCDVCGESGCARMGYYSNLDTNSGVAVKYYLKTRSEAPFSEDAEIY